jgi:hypothetical protein
MSWNPRRKTDSPKRRDSWQTWSIVGTGEKGPIRDALEDPSSAFTLSILLFGIASLQISERISVGRSENSSGFSRRFHCPGTRGGAISERLFIAAMMQAIRGCLVISVKEKGKEELTFLS